MDSRVIDILTGYKKSKAVCALGNEAIARGAIEAGVGGVFSYPGTPSTEISDIFNQVSSFQLRDANRREYPGLAENPVYFEYSINEKIALEKAIAYSIGNKSALCIMKNVGMNVASDALMSITYQTIAAPLVIVVCDDPGCHSSSNEQDSRYWGTMASVPVFNPATPEEALQMTKDAFLLSDALKLPVIVRTTTRVSHTRNLADYGAIRKTSSAPRFDRVPENINIPAKTTTAHCKLIDKLHSERIKPFFERHNRSFQPAKAGIAIITSGVAHAYALELLYRNGLSGKVATLSLGLIHPFPEQQVSVFISRGYERILVLEELEPIIENAVRIIAQKRGLTVEIFGKGFSLLTNTGEFSLDLVRETLEKFTGKRFSNALPVPLTGIGKFTDALPPRPPTLCSGCPHRATFYALKLCIPKNTETGAGGDVVLCGDIGCFGLGALPPLKMIDTINHMGMSISMAQGLGEAFRNSGTGTKLVALVGDGTFFHSGVASLMNAVYTRSNMLLVIFDNRTIGMTGRQDHPGASQNSGKYRELDIERLIAGMGIQAETISPFDLKDTFRKVNDAMRREGVAVLISKSPCVLLSHQRAPSGTERIIIDKSRCNSCANHADLNISCSKKQNPMASLARARAKIAATVSIPGDEQLCPANICNHGFFNSILEGAYKTAINLVRDKMLFARTCGDICHRPCELFAGAENKPVIPIRQLKKFVSSSEERFRDFSGALYSAAHAEKKGKHIAVVGAGPAGLSAAYDLIRNGYEVTVMEKEAEAGGLVKHAIPDFRMDKAGFDYEANILKELGVKFCFNTSLGRDFQLEGLAREYDAVLLAVGMGKALTPSMIREHLPNNRYTDAVSFLKAYNTGEFRNEESMTTLVIGGGNSAIDAARAAKKLHAESKVYISCIEPEEQMPAFAEEIERALEERIKLIPGSCVVKCADNHRIEIELGALGDKKTLHRLSVDRIITAIGQESDPDVLKGLHTDETGRVPGAAGSGQTNIANVFVAGDISSGNHMSVIGAIAGGKQAVTGIRNLLEGYTFEYEGKKAFRRLNEEEPGKTPAAEINTPENLIRDIRRFNLFQACRKCNHCIDNFGCPALIKVDGKIEVDEVKCTRCGLCIDVCPNDAIQWSEVKVEEPETA